MTVTSVIITKNEEKNIEACLKTLRFCDAIMVIDQHSSDKTREFAKKNNATVFPYDAKDFADARTFALQKVTTDWVLYVDADERVTDTLAKAIKQTMATNNPKAAYRVQRKNFYFGDHPWPYIEKLERFFQRKYLRGWYGQLHESPMVEGELGELSGFLHHYTHTDLSSMVEKTNDWSNIEARLRFDSAHPKMTWWRFPRVMLQAFLTSYILQKGWKAGTIGLIESIYQSFSVYITYAKLWELQQKKHE